MQRVTTDLISLGSRVTPDHEFTLLVGSILLLPSIAFITEFVHLTWIDAAELLPARKTNYPQTLEIERSNSILEL
jgi:hypothetical protein